MKFKAIAALLVIVPSLAASSVYATRQTSAGYPVPAGNQVFYGVQLDTEQDSLDAYAARIGKTPAVVGRYVGFPMDAKELAETNDQVQAIATRHGSLMLTLEPRQNLSAVTPEAAQELTKDLTRWNRQGVPVLVRFAHEMNGAWYPWGQDPTAYIPKFRLIADAVHQASRSSILWSPNEGGAYPYQGGRYQAQPGTEAMSQLDTNHDGQLTEADDPYAPYWPGDGYVDWVGLSVYHFGASYPWGENEVPSPNKLIGKITGTYKDAAVDQTIVPDFYHTYAVVHDKPFAISETGALYNASRSDGASELAIKQAWWDQLFSQTLTKRFPQLKLAAWFEHQKTENDTGSSIIDWRATGNDQIKSQYQVAMPANFVSAPIDK